MPVSQTGSVKLHVQIFRDDEQGKRALANIENGNKWTNGFLVRVASVIQKISN